MENYEYYGDDFDASAELEREQQGNEIYDREVGIAGGGGGFGGKSPLGRLLPSMYTYEEDSTWNTLPDDGNSPAVDADECSDFCSSSWGIPDEIRWPPPPPPAPPSLLDESDESLPDGLLSMVASSSSSSASLSMAMPPSSSSFVANSSRSCHYCHWATEETAPGIVEIFRKGEAPNDVVFVIVTACCVGGALLGMFIALAVFKRKRRRSKLLANDASALTTSQRQHPMSKSNSGAGLGICEAVLYGTTGSTSSSRSRASSLGLIPPGNIGMTSRAAVYWDGGGRGGCSSKTTTMTVENHYTSIEEVCGASRGRYEPPFPVVVPDEQYRLKTGVGRNYYSSTLTKAELGARNPFRDHFPSASSDYDGSPRRQRRPRPSALNQNNRTLLVKPNRSSSFLLVHPNPVTFERDPRCLYEDPLEVHRAEGSFDTGRQRQRRRRERRPRAPPPIHAPPPPPPSLSPMRFVNHREDPLEREL